MTTTIDLIEIADKIANTNTKNFSVGKRCIVFSSKLSTKYPTLQQLLVDTPIIAIAKSQNGIYGTTLQIWDMDGVPTVYDVDGLAIDQKRVRILSVLVGRSSGIASVILDGLQLKISANLTDECLLRNYPKDGVLVELGVDVLNESLREKPDSFVKLSDEKIPLNVNFQILGVSGYTKKYTSPVYRVKYVVDGVTKHIDRLLPNTRLRKMVENGTKNFFVSQRYKKTNTDGVVIVKLKLYDADEPVLTNILDDVDFDD